MTSSIKWFLSGFVKFRSAVERRSKKCLSQSETRAAIFVFRLEKNDRGRRVLAGCHISSNYVQQLQMESGKCISQLEATIAVFLLRSARKLQAWQWTLSTFFLQSFVKSIQWLPRRSRNVSNNQRPGWPSLFSDIPEEQELDRGRRVLATCQVSSNSRG